MRTVKIGFSKPKGWFKPFSWAIRFIQRTPFSHVYVRQITKYGVDLIYQASGSHVNFMSSKIFDAEEIIVREFAFTIEDNAYDNYMKFALETVGKPYGVGQVFGILFMELFRLKRNPFAKGNSDYVCSELVGEILYSLIGENITHADLDHLTPGDILEFCLKNQPKFK